MLAAIDLDGQLRAETADIRDVGTDRDLPPDMRAVEGKTTAQVAPQVLFRFRTRAAEPLRVGCRAR